MKCVNYQNTDFTVPDWANYIAGNSDGKVFVFSHRPYVEFDAGEWNWGVRDKGGMRRLSQELPQLKDREYPVKELFKEAK